MNIYKQRRIKMANYNLEADISVQEIALGGTDDFMLYQFIMDSKSKSYIKDVFVKFKGKLIAKNYRDTLELFSMLDSFIKKGLVKGDENKGFKHILLKHYHNNDLDTMDILNMIDIYIRGIKLQNEGLSNRYLTAYMRINKQKEYRLILNENETPTLIITSYRKV